MKRFLILLLALVTAITLAACTASDNAGEEPDNTNNTNNTENNEDANNNEEDEASGEKVLYMNNGEEPTSFNPSIGFDGLSWGPLNNLMEGLTRLDADFVASPGAAEDWEISDDGLTYTFHIREDANWSNGDPLVAEDFVYAWKLMLNPLTDPPSPAAFLAYFIEGAEELNSAESEDEVEELSEGVQLTAVDDKTLEVVLTSPTGFFLDLLTNPAFFPVHHKIAEENPNWHAEADSFVANGPFMLESWDHDSSMVFAKNEEYWDADVVNLDKVDWVMVNDTNTSYQMFERGDLDTGSIPPELSDELIDGDNVYIGEQGGLEFYRFNITKEPFQNKKIRQAFAFAIDREAITEYVVKNRVEPAYGFISPGFTGPSGEDFRETNGDLVTLDPDKAAELLKEGMEEEGYDELPEVVLSYNTSDSNKAVAETIQDMLIENLDVEVKLENQEWAVFAEAQQNLELHFSRSSFINDYNDPVNFLESFITDSYMNRTGFSSEAYDELIANGKGETDEEKRWDYMYEAEQMLADEMIAMPIRFYNNVTLEQDGISGIIRPAVGYIDLKYADKN